MSSDVPDQPRRRDAEIRDELRNRLIADTRIGLIDDTDRITIDVRNGVATLTGSVESEMAKRAAGDDSWDVPGVIDVYNNLRIVR